MLGGRRVALCVAFAIGLGPGWLPRAAAGRGRAGVSVQAVERGEAGGERTFRVRLRWPAEGVPDYYRDFLQLGKAPAWFGPRDEWPPDALMLIPQGRDAFCVLRQLVDDESDSPPIWRSTGSRPPAEAVFVGRLAPGEPGRLAFSLRCPGADGRYRYLPVELDLGRARKSPGLGRAWLRAEANFFATFPAPEGQGFFDFAYRRALRRLGGRSRGVMLPRARGSGPPRTELCDAGERRIPLSALAGPEPSPRPPAVEQKAAEASAALVPADQYYLRFASGKALLDCLDLATRWGDALHSVLGRGASPTAVRARLERQLCLPARALAGLDPKAVRSVVLTGLDPRLDLGADLAAIFETGPDGQLEAALDRAWQACAREGYARREIRCGGLEVRALGRAGRRVRSFRARLGDFVVVSNSPALVERIAGAFEGRSPSLAASADFAALRGRLPFEAGREHAFACLPRPWLRALRGPRMRILAMRRRAALASLETIRQAAMLFRFEHPHDPVPGLERLGEQGYLDPDALQREPDDRLSWDPERLEASSARYGRPGAMTPRLELPIDRVSELEKRACEQAEPGWLGAVESAAAQLALGERIELRFELGLQSGLEGYQRLRALLGQGRAALEPQRRRYAALHLGAHIDPGSAEMERLRARAVDWLPGHDRATVAWPGERLELWLEDDAALSRLTAIAEPVQLFALPVVLGVAVEDRASLGGFLVAVQEVLRADAEGPLVLEPARAHRGQSLRCVRALPPLEARLCYAAKGDMLYASTRLEALERVLDARTARARAGPEESLSLRLDLDRARELRRAAGRVLAGMALEAEIGRLRDAWLQARTLGPEAGAVSPLGNRYRYQAGRDELTGSQTGSVWALEPLERLPRRSPLGRLLGRLRGLRVGAECLAGGLRGEIVIRLR
ncbi:MAG: hypothetical protein JXR96_30255 [Deltaproteobacteria bacterium]|nr:hypothetical protein [Deltaproteobacteria bacterium]